MKTKSRIESILKTNSLDFSITGLPTFNLSELDLITDLEFQLPTNIRLGHLAEKIVSELIKSSSNYKVLYENIQVIDGKKTIGEIDFIIEDNKLKQGKFLPGMKIAIKSKESLKEKTDYLLVLAWNFFNEIKKNNSDLADKLISIKDLEI
mgnify:CR=1 FL=1